MRSGNMAGSERRTVTNHLIVTKGPLIVDLDFPTAVMDTSSMLGGKK